MKFDKKNCCNSLFMVHQMGKWEWRQGDGWGKIGRGNSLSSKVSAETIAFFSARQRFKAILFLEGTQGRYMFFYILRKFLNTSSRFSDQHRNGFSQNRGLTWGSLVTYNKNSKRTWTTLYPAIGYNCSIEIEFYVCLKKKLKCRHISPWSTLFTGCLRKTYYIM